MQDKDSNEARLVRLNRTVALLVTALVGLGLNAESHDVPPEKKGMTPGLHEALTSVVTPGGFVSIEGPPSGFRDRGDGTESADSAKEYFDRLRNDPTGLYQEVQKNFLTTLHADADLESFSRHAQARYESLILRHVPSPTLTRIETEHFTLVYPPDYDANNEVVSVPTRRLTIHAVDRFGDARHLVAYFSNYDKVDPQHRSVVFQINGHFGRNPSRQGLGMEGRGGSAGAALGKLGLRGIPLITYDDHQVGESSPATGKENGQYRTLANLRMMDDSLLIHFARVDGMGLSGGCERLYHFLAFHRCRLATAYLAGFLRPPWLDLYHWRKTAGKRGVDHDTFNEVFYSSFQWTDLVLVGIHRGVKVRVAPDVRDFRGKNVLEYEMLPAIRRYTNRVAIGGDDPDSDGISNSGRNLGHEYDLIDYLKFLEASRSGI